MTAPAPGWPVTDLDLWSDSDLRSGFLTPPPGWGEIAFFWWSGAELTRERLLDHLDRLTGWGISGLQINYAHGDHGARWGLSIPSDPPLFSEAWWELVAWFAGEARQRGMWVSLSDYTLGGVGYGGWTDEIRRDLPDIGGLELRADWHAAGTGIDLVLPLGTLAVSAQAEGGTCQDLSFALADGRLRWTPPAAGWRVVVVRSEAVEPSVNPLDPRLGPETVARVFQRMADRLGAEAAALNGFFSDELEFGVRGQLWHPRLPDEFQRRKGYALLSVLPALFADGDPRQIKTRLDVADVVTALIEESYFIPVYEWHAQRGLLYGCDHGGRGTDPVEFTDYARTQRWTTGPGNDQPNLAAAVVQGKVHSSLAHLYRRPRTWLEGFYGSGWGTTPAQLTRSMARNLVLGANLLSLHGLYYDTMGGWWEWAPPDNHWRMPYGRHMPRWLDWCRRLCWLLSQGVHRCDVAVLYPTAAVQADAVGGATACRLAFAAIEHLVEAGLDADFIDDDSLAAATVAGDELHHAGERWRVLVLADAVAMRHATLLAAERFAAAGGHVVLLGRPPAVTERVSGVDPEVESAVATLRSRGHFLEDGADLVATVSGLIERDVVPLGAACRVLHREVSGLHVYWLVGAAAGDQVRLRQAGRVERWDPWSGTVVDDVLAFADGTGMRVTLPIAADDGVLLMVRPGPARGGEVVHGGSVTLPPLPLEGPWEFTLEPTLDNRWGDFALPAEPRMIGAEMRCWQMAREAVEVDDRSWKPVVAGYGSPWAVIGPPPAGIPAAAIERALLAAVDLHPGCDVLVGTTKIPVESMAASVRWGLAADPGRQGWHGLKARVHDENFAVGQRHDPGWVGLADAATWGGDGGPWWLATRVWGPEANSRVTVQLSGPAPDRIWIDGLPVPWNAPLRVRRGARLVVRLPHPGRGGIALRLADAPAHHPQRLATTWWGDAAMLPLSPWAPGAICHLRGVAAPGCTGFQAAVHGEVQAWVDGQPVALLAGGPGPAGSRWWICCLPQPLAHAATITLRVVEVAGGNGGAALEVPVRLDCDGGLLPCGDWSANATLADYSGGAWYRRTIELDAARATCPTWLDLGTVAASAEVLVNGATAGVLLAPPWCVPLQGLLRPGLNRIEVLVCSTLANRYRCVPSRYRGDPTAGLLGPVQLVHAI